jgi:hypothetical protein
MADNSKSLDTKTRIRGQRLLLAYIAMFVLPYWVALFYFTYQHFSGS